MRVTTRTAIIPMAGRNDRFLPATRSVPHALLPVLDTPLIQFAIDEAEAAGVERIVFVTSPGNDSIRDYVTGGDAAVQWLDASRGIDGAVRLDSFRSRTDVAFAVQAQPLGLGHAVLQAAPHALPGPVAVILPDDLILGAPCLPELADRYQRSGAGHMVATASVPRESVSHYGILDPMHAARDRSVRAVGVVEKPSPQEAPSLQALVGRYVLHPGIFGDLAALRAAPGARIELTRAIARGIDRVGLSGFVFSGRWFDCGTPDGLLDAAIALRAQRRSVALALAAE